MKAACFRYRTFTSRLHSVNLHAISDFSAVSYKGKQLIEITFLFEIDGFTGGIDPPTPDCFALRRNNTLLFIVPQ